MIKFSLALLTAAIVMVNVGCDSNCCGPTNAAPVVKSIGNYRTNGATVTCTSAQFPLQVDATDPDNDIDSYEWSVDGQTVSPASITCPQPGETKKVCVTAIDKLAHKSDPFCLTVKGSDTAAPVVTAINGITTNNQTVNCSSITPPFTATATDADNDIDHYVWEVDGQTVSPAGMTCPQPGESQKVCVTAVDKTGNVSNKFCINVQKDAVACQPKITILDESNNTLPQNTTLRPGGKYLFTNNAENCPAETNCTWSVRSHKNPNFPKINTNPPYITCLINNVEQDKNTYNGGASKHIQLNNVGNTVNLQLTTCNVIGNNNVSKYDQLEVKLECTNPTYSETKIFPIVP